MGLERFADEDGSDGAGSDGAGSDGNEESSVSIEMILRCEDSLEGIFTAIYDAFVYKNRMEQPYTDSIQIAIGEGGNLSLFAREISVVTDADKVYKTVHTIQNRLGYSVYDTLLCALCHFAEDRGSAVLGYLVRAFAKGKSVSEHLSDPYVMRVMELSRKVCNERQRFYGFLRFQLVPMGQLDGLAEAGAIPGGEKGILWAQMEPKCNLVPLMMEHFSDRYPNEHFIIYDPIRKLAAVHEAYHACVLVMGQDLSLSRGEGDYIEELWKHYFASVEIKARHNERCQQNMMPVWHRKHMPELTPTR